MCVNSFSICNQEYQSLGTGLYLGASIVDHSCKPNAVVTFEGTTLVMRALEKIPNLDFNKVSYWSIFYCTMDSMKALFIYKQAQCIKYNHSFDKTTNSAKKNILNNKIMTDLLMQPERKLCEQKC